MTLKYFAPKIDSLKWAICRGFTDSKVPFSVKWKVRQGLKIDDYDLISVEVLMFDKLRDYEIKNHD